MTFDTKEDAYHAGFADGSEEAYNDGYNQGSDQGEQQRHELEVEIEGLKNELVAERNLGMKLAAKLLELGEDIVACLKTQ